MAHTATRTVGKDADTASSKNIFLLASTPRAARACYVDGTPVSCAVSCAVSCGVQLGNANASVVTCNFTKLITDVATRPACPYDA